MDAIKYTFGFDMSKIVKKIEYVFLPNLLQYIEREIKKDMKSDL